MWKILLLGLSVSIDSWAVGAAYQADDIKIPWLTKVIVSAISAATSLVAVLLGNGLKGYVETFWIQMIGGIVLALIGIKSLWGVWTHRKEPDCDSNASKVIEPIEGIVLGGVLASDSFSAGLSLCGMGAARVFPLVVGILTYLFLMLADKKIKCSAALNSLAAAALVVIGVVQAFGW